VLNRANGRLRLFRKEGDFLAFFECVREALARQPMRILGWCVMGNHWHMVVWPEREGELSRFFGHLGLLHASRWQVAHKAVGTGHVYQGRFKSFMVQEDEHLLAVLRYVERNALRKNLVKRAEDWRWGSLHAWCDRGSEYRDLLSDWPVARPRDWRGWVNKVATRGEKAEAEQELAIQESIRRGRPLGDEGWVLATARDYGLMSTIRPRGRPVGWRKERDVGDAGG
jgi:putative transposase